MCIEPNDDARSIEGPACALPAVRRRDYVAGGAHGAVADIVFAGVAKRQTQGN